jgi:hypothetical protein
MPLGRLAISANLTDVTEVVQAIGDDVDAVP